MRIRSLALIAFVFIAVFSYSHNTAYLHRSGISWKNSYTAIDTFYNTVQITKSHFKDALVNKIECKICSRLPNFSRDTTVVSLESIEIIGARIFIVDNKGLILYRDSLSDDILSIDAVRHLSVSPSGTRVLVDKIQAYRHYDIGDRDAHIVRLTPIFYELVE